MQNTQMANWPLYFYHILTVRLLISTCRTVQKIGWPGMTWWPAQSHHRARSQAGYHSFSVSPLVPPPHPLLPSSCSLFFHLPFLLSLITFYLVHKCLLHLSQLSIIPSCYWFVFNFSIFFICGLPSITQLYQKTPLCNLKKTFLILTEIFIAGK